MKKFLIFTALILLVFIGIRIFSSYTILPFPKSGGKKHKIYNVYAFPDPMLVTFNPFKTKLLKENIIKYSASDQYVLSNDSMFGKYPENIHNYFTNYRGDILQNNFRLLSIKYEGRYFHILVGKKNDPQSTIVFRFSTETNQVVSHY